jgi:GMP synthase (glutamine-hydrolysing)
MRTFAVERARRPLVVVADFGGTFGQLTARKVFELGYPVRVLAACEKLYSRLHHLVQTGGGRRRLYLILSACHLDQDPRIDERIFDLPVPVLGICNGFQLIARAFGGKVVDISPREIGQFELVRTLSMARDPLDGLPASFYVSMFHRQSLLESPPGFSSLGATSQSPVAAFSSTDSRLVGFQFHPEMPDTEFGSTILLSALSAEIGLPFFSRRVTSRWLMSSVDRLREFELRQNGFAG